MRVREPFGASHLRGEGARDGSGISTNASEMAGLLQDALNRAAHYLANLPARPVAPTTDALAALSAFDEPFPESPADPAATLELLDRVGSPATVASAGGRYFGFVNGAVLPSSFAAHILATAWDQNAALSVMSPVASRLRTVVSRWIVSALGLPSGTEAMFVGGATVANVCGLAAGRDHVLAQAGWDAANDGLIGAPPLTVVVGDQAHSTSPSRSPSSASAATASSRSRPTIKVASLPHSCRTSQAP